MVWDGLAYLTDYFTADDMSDIACYSGTCRLSCLEAICNCFYVMQLLIACFVYFVYDSFNNN